jgi:hypothetical protein
LKRLWREKGRELTRFFGKSSANDSAGGTALRINGLRRSFNQFLEPLKYPLKAVSPGAGGFQVPPWQMLGVHPLAAQSVFVETSKVLPYFPPHESLKRPGK